MSDFLEHASEAARTYLSELPRTTTSPEDTRTVGARLARLLAPGAVVALYGDLGSGKTQFVKGCCAALGVPEAEVSSPTFTILHEYAGRTADGTALPIYHFDAYRIEHPDEFYALGYEEYFYGDGLCLVEWPARVEALIPERALRLRLAHAGGDERLVERLSISE